MLGKKIFYAVMPDFKAEIKLTDAQIKGITDAFEGCLTIDGDRIMITMHGMEDMPAMEKAAMKVLTPEQTKRLTECWLQKVEATAAADDEIAKVLGLTEKQRKDIDRLLEVGWDEMQGLFQSGAHDEATQKAAEESRKKTAKKVEAVLTDEQKKALEKMKGAPMKKRDKPVR